ncbi:MAG: cobalt transporter CbiM, partial [Candidatus Omnitrophica bacterium]|nr:cobalt transporter CbiM [Candidatus Omnitrophota bacterium]
MHISDGVLTTPVWTAGYAASIAIVAFTTRKMRSEDVPKTAIMTSVFFVSSLIHVPIGPTSVHLLLNGLIGMLLGPLAFIAVFLGLILQAILFQHGGITTIGVNTLIMGLPALLVYKIFDLHKIFSFRLNKAVFGVLAGGSAVFFATLLLAAFLITTGDAFMGAAKIAALAHLPVMIVEAIITGVVASFIGKVK